LPGAGDGAALDAFIDDALAARGLADKDLALVGFSQGTMMALYVGLRAPAGRRHHRLFRRLIGAETLARDVRSKRVCCWSMATPIR